jgi:hypothetical protein
MAEQTFKVGDKVEHVTGGTCEVRFGPYRTRWNPGVYLLEMADGTFFAASWTEITPVPVAPAFAVGDTVTLSTCDGARATVEYGPFDDRDVYVVRLVDEPGNDNPRTFTALANIMGRAPALVPVGTRVRVDRAKHAEEQHGKFGVVTSNTEDFREHVGDPHVYEVQVNGGKFYVAELTPIDEPADGNTFEYAGVTYDVTAKYRDSDGDVWEFTDRDDRTPFANLSTPGYPTESLRAVARQYGPLTKI